MKVNFFQNRSCVNYDNTTIFYRHLKSFERPIGYLMAFIEVFV